MQTIKVGFILEILLVNNILLIAYKTRYLRYYITAL